jgi:hypothetical protein
VRAVTAAVRDFNRPGGLASRVRPETTAALVNALSGQATDDQKTKLYAELLAELRTPVGDAALPPTPVQIAVSSETLRAP